jgi:hypothetical protein
LKRGDVFVQADVSDDGAVKNSRVEHRIGERTINAVAACDRLATSRYVDTRSDLVTLDRLERKGLVQSRLGEPTPERGGRAKTYFHVTAKGLREVRRARQTLIKLWGGVRQLEGGMA